MASVKEIYQALDRIAPFSLTMDFDNTGILLGDPQQRVTKAFLALDCSNKILNLAKEQSAQLIVTHHPVIFNPLKKLTENMLAFQLVQNKISVISAHTNLDLAAGGVNDVLAKLLSLDKLSGLEEVPGKNAFLGRVGELAEPLSPKGFAGYVKSRLQAQTLRYTTGGRLVRKVAVCSGSGGACVAAALAAGADALVTGDVKHDQFMDAAQAGLTLVDAGHFDTEDIILDPLRDTLTALVPDVEWISNHARTIHIA